MMAAVSVRRVTALGNGSSKRGVAWAARHSLAWQGTPKVLYGEALSLRFVVRLLAACLPTYENISARIKDGNNIYGYVWGSQDLGRHEKVPLLWGGDSGEHGPCTEGMSSRGGDEAKGAQWP